MIATLIVIVIIGASRNAHFGQLRIVLLRWHEYRSRGAPHGDRAFIFRCIDATMWTFQYQRRGRVVRPFRIVRCVQYEFGGAVAVKEMTLRAQNELALRAEDPTAGTAIVREQSARMAFA